MGHTVRQLLAAPDEGGVTSTTGDACTTTVEAAYGVERPSRAGRPWVGLCMITTIDGATALDGRSGGLGNASDRAMLMTLRRTADLVIVGAGTAAGEGYGPPRKSGQRIGVFTNSGRIDPTAALFAGGAGFVVAPERADVPFGVDTLRVGRDKVDVAAAIARLDEVVPGLRYVTAEGGPTFNGSLLAADVIDEIDLTMAPMTIGGASTRISFGGPEIERRFALTHLLVDDFGYLLTRWTRGASG